MDKVVLHQLYQVVPPDARVWVIRHRLSKLPEAIRLLENYMDAEPGVLRGMTMAHPRPPGGNKEQKTSDSRA